jgi:hypothetical protein
MAIIFADNFNYYNASQILRVWDGQSGAIIEAVTPRRVGENYLKLSFNSQFVSKNIPSVNTLAIGFALYISALEYNHEGFLLGNLSGIQVGVFINIDGSISVRRGITTIIGTSTAGLFRPATWNWIEFKITIDNAAGSYDVKLNGRSILSASGVDTQYQSSADCTRVVLQGVAYIADLYFADDLLGDSRVDFKLANGVGNHSDFTPVGAANNFDCVNDPVPADDDTTYVKSSTVGHKDSYTFEDLPVINGIIHGVVALSLARKDEAESRSFRTFTRIGGIDYNGVTTQYPSDNYKYHQQVFDVNPATGVAWLKAGVDAAEFGVELLS